MDMYRWVIYKIEGTQYLQNVANMAPSSYNVYVQNSCIRNNYHAYVCKIIKSSCLPSYYTIIGNIVCNMTNKYN